jgi:uncharacterized protein
MVAKMSVVCMYHVADYDGICSGAIVKHWRKNTILVGVDYHYNFEEYRHYISAQNDVYIIDFTWPLETMKWIEAKTRNLIWIDHHISAIKEAEEALFNPLGLRRSGTAACQLTWEYLLSSRALIGCPTPEAVELLGRYDVWDLDDKVLAFQYGVKAANLKAESPEWTNLFTEDGSLDEHLVNEILDIGAPVLNYVNADAEKYMASFAYETEIDGLRILACNRAKVNFLFFKSMYDPEKHDAVCAYAWTGSRYAASFYTDKEDVDVSVLAKKFGGGGHKKAAGFSSMALPWETKC